MACLKCGKETQGSHVFCQHCQAAMDAAPVKPGTPVHLPHRVEPSDRKPRHKAPSPAETIRSLKRMIHWLVAIVAALTVIICIMTGVLLRTIDQQNNANLIGKNYTTTTDITTQP